MRNVLISLPVLTAILAASAAAEERALHHNVYFKLKDNSAETKGTFMAACENYLTGHAGMTAFAVGPIAEEFQRDVNDRDFDVAIQIVFENKAAHDAYMKAERHAKFIEETQPNWEKVRVFNWYAESQKQAPSERQAMAKALRTAAKTQILALKTPLQVYRLDVGDYPATAAGLRALWEAPKDLGESARWAGPYVKELPLDPWKRPYRYEWPGKHGESTPDIWSAGPDGVDGTDDDVVSWERKSGGDSGGGTGRR